MNKKYVYYYNMFSSASGEVKIKYKNFFGKMFCNHHFLDLVRIEKNSLFLNPLGDEIETICPKCGKSLGTMFWEYEGMGYK